MANWIRTSKLSSRGYSINWNKRQEDTYMMKDEMQKQVKPMEKWIKNVGQKFSWSRNNFSEMRVITPENNRTVQPEGKQLVKENAEESCREKNTYPV